MFDRFSSSAELAVVHAQHEARIRGRRDVTSGDLVVGLARANPGLASRVGLAGLGPITGARDPALAPSPGRWSEDALDTLNRAEAMVHADRKIEDVDLLLAALEAGGPAVARTLAAAGVDAASVRERLRAEP